MEKNTSFDKLGFMLAILKQNKNHEYAYLTTQCANTQFSVDSLVYTGYTTPKPSNYNLLGPSYSGNRPRDN